MFGAGAGLALAEILLRVFIAMAPEGIPFLAKAHLDLRIVLFTAAVSVLCAAAFGILPALERPRPAALVARYAHTGAHALLRRCLVAGQIAVSMVLLVAAGLLIRSFSSLERQPMGIDTTGVLAVHIALPGYRYTTAQQQMDFFLAAEAALRRLPGVSAVGMTNWLPPADTREEQIFSLIEVPGRPRPAEGTGGMVSWRWVTPEYFNALGIPILRGQNFTAQQRTSNENFLILSSLLASRLFGNQDPVGQHVKPVPAGPWYTVTGVEANVKNGGLIGADDPEFYRLRRNVAADWHPWNVMVLKTSLPPAAVVPWVRGQIASIDPTLPIQVETLNQSVSKLADGPRFETALLGLFAFCGLLMAVIGLYGVLSFVATQRTQEIGVRMALGATRLHIVRLIAGEGLRLIFAGGALGLAASFASARLVRSLLFNVTPYDPMTYALVPLLLALVALAATLIPARAAMKVEPVVALRCE